MNNKYRGSINNAWKKMSNNQMNMINEKIGKNVSLPARKGEFIRTGYLNFGATQLTNYNSFLYLYMGGRGHGTVG